MIGVAVLLMVSAIGCDSRASAAEHMVCARTELEEAEKALAGQLARAIDNARLNDHNGLAVPYHPSREARLHSAQQAWLAYRDAHCDAQFLAPVARDLEDVSKIWCRTRLTKERAAELSRLFIVD